MKRVITPLILISVLIDPVALQASEPENAAKAFSSDSSSVSTLAGTIIGGALTAHPAGTMVGGIIGFFAGDGNKKGEDNALTTKSASAKQSFDSTLPDKTRLGNPSICQSYATVTSTETQEANASTTAFINFGTVFASQEMPQEENTGETPIQLAMRAQLQQRLCYYMMN
jgi:hypothetical protein